ncbi:unnamed protein product [Fraxinus pennsylvanica]|uniref:Uncharacterized protein n=1 Tax=Fraxinus pennsylvanica TaxID=56036 RepID=A0AAD2AFJ1_9LAMI|nr:unnamed protein product [Fraxinus pennsylvanica]
MEEEEDSGVCSPPLWNNVPQKIPSDRPLLHHNRVQDIVRGQGELMEMVKNWPESSYELSLKDFVEPSMIETQDQDQEEGSDKLTKNHDNQVPDQRMKVKRQESMIKEKRAKMIRYGSIGNMGLFLKMRCHQRGLTRSGGRKDLRVQVTVIIAEQAIPTEVQEAAAAVVAAMAAGERMASYPVAGPASTQNKSILFEEKLAVQVFYILCVMEDLIILFYSYYYCCTAFDVDRENLGLTGL